MYEWCMNDVYMAQSPKIVIVLSVLQNRNKILNQSINHVYITMRDIPCQLGSFWAMDIYIFCKPIAL